jgi:WS/DGAT/MGAT family acyltransferase
LPSSLTHRLSAQDAAFLYLERPNAALHIGSLAVYEGRVPYEQFVAHLEARMPLIPRYRQRVAFVPLNLGHPTWEDDPTFQVRNQVHHVTLARPGTDAQLFQLAAELFAPPLDRDRPLWEMFVIDGLEGDRSAIVSRVHHCMVDGVSGIELLVATLDISPEPAPPPEPEAAAWTPKPLPGTTERLNAALWDNVDQQREIWRDFLEGVANPQRRLKEMQDTMRALGRALPLLARPAPRLPFYTRLTDKRQAAFSEVSFVEIREIRTALGGTVNDVVLAILAGALRRYLSEHGIDVSGIEPRVAIPVNVRLEDESGSLGNRVSAMFAPLPIGEANPVERFRMVQERVTGLKEENQAGAFELLMRAASYAPAPVHALNALAVTSSTAVNMVCTNVPGPMIPLYCVGHMMLAHYPLVPLSLDMGLGVGVTSYNHRLFFGLMADPNAVPDIDRLRECVDESFLELRNAAGVSPAELPALRGQTNGHAPAGAPVAAVEQPG